MRSFPILWQLACRHIHILVHAHTQFKFLLLSFNPEQRAWGVINQLASEKQLGGGAGRVSFTQRDVGFQIWPGSLFLLWGTVYLPVCALDCLSKAFGYCVLLDMRRTNTSGGVLDSPVRRVSVCDCLTSGKLLMLTIMSWGDLIEIWPSWFRGNFPSWVVTMMWSRAPEQIQINTVVCWAAQSYG